MNTLMAKMTSRANEKLCSSQRQTFSVGLMMVIGYFWVAFVADVHKIKKYSIKNTHTHLIQE